MSSSSASETREVLQACMASRRNLEQIFEALDDGIVASTEKRRVFHMNRAAEKLLGVSSSELLGKNLDAHLSVLADRPVAFVQRALNDGKPTTPEIVELSIAGTAPERIRISTRLLEEDNAVRGVVLILHDETEVERLRADLKQARGLGNIVGTSAAMRNVFDLIHEVARAEATVLIEGETGTGKELVANAIHQLSSRSEGPLVTINCAALPEGLLESELFGHVEGAFTGAISNRAGRFEIADGGTLFLDEVGEISPAVQVKLLRVIQDRTFERVGDNTPRHANVRLMSATNKELLHEVQQERFREDLYYRLSVFPIKLPPLRDRMDDLPILVSAIIERLVSGSTPPSISPEAMQRLQNHGWPGNVRELHTAIEYALIRSHNERIRPEHLPAHVSTSVTASVDHGVTRETVHAAIERHGGNRTRAASSLGISRVTLWRKMKEWDMHEE